MNLTGTWAGEYTYGRDYESVPGKSVRFTLALEQRGRLGLFAPSKLTGFVRDNVDDGGQPERGTLVGHIRRGEVSFTKDMPVRYIIDEHGEMLTLLEWYKQGGYEPPRGMIAKDFGSQRIGYQGRIDDLGARMSGTWWMISQQGGEPGDHGTGTWSAQRTSRDTSPP